ncbi:MAG TPA: LptF/LptG family permease, partial [Bryobacteraceae bacterium]|nr:LptF/LptG family permease [Bryobacteraceae bacterium]
MRILTRAIFREIIASALLGTLLFTFVLFLQRAGRSFELLARSSSGFETLAYLFTLILPFTLTFSLPVGALVGILIGLSRMSSDGEIVGMRAAGVPSRQVIRPVLGMALVFMVLTAACTMWLTPFSIRETYRVLNRLSGEQVTAQVQPRVFQEQFPGAILYVSDVIPGPVERWRSIFIADDRPAGPGAPHREGEGPRILLAREGIAIPDLKNNRVQLHLVDVNTHEVGKEPREYLSSAYPVGDQVLQATRSNEKRTARPFQEMDMGPLWRAAGDSRDAAIELHQRLALPLACVLLALAGVPVGVSSRKSGKSAAFVVTVALAFFYYMGMISLINLAREGTMPVWLAVWTPNIVVAALAAVMLTRLDKPGDRDVVAQLKGRFEGLWRRLRGLAPGSRPAPVRNGSRVGRVPLLPQIVDTYILSTFLFYFAMLLASFVLMAEVFTFFELLGDIVKNRIPMASVAAYLFFLTPKLIYDSTPISVLVAVLVTFGVMSKHNEVTAFKATGVSLHRLSAPVLIASLVLSAGLFAFDYYQVLPQANRRQDALRAEIKGNAVQTFLRPDRKYIFGQGSRIYYYKFFDPQSAVMVGVSVYELNRNPFRLKKHISAERAQWNPALKAWVFT